VSTKKYREPRCDACSKRIRRNQHELVLSDFLTGQVVGCYHVRRDCQAAATKYLMGGAVLRATYAHPPRCGVEYELCDGGLSEAVA
jgi:hypothetical protein